MKKLDLYIAKEMVLPFLIGTLVIVIMFQANTYMWLAEQYNIRNIPLVAQFQYIFYMTPSFLKMTLPAGMSLAASLAVTRLARDSEITIMRSCGVPILRILVPVTAFGVMASVINFYNVEVIVPIANQKMQDIAAKNQFLGGKAVFKSNAFLQLGSYAASLGAVEEVGPDKLKLHKILLIDRSDGRITSFYTADEGTYLRGTFTFPNATAYAISGEDVHRFDAKKVVISQEVNFEQIFNTNSNAIANSNEGKSTPELRKAIAQGIASHSNVRDAQIELYKRFSIPFACIVFSVTSPIFAISFARSGGFAGVLVSFVVVMLYYNGFMISTGILGKLDYVPAWITAWLPNIVFGTLGIIAIRRLE